MYKACKVATQFLISKGVSEENTLQEAQDMIEKYRKCYKITEDCNMDKKEEMLREAVHDHYQCNGKYACEERAYCRFCEGENIAHDCDEDCFADEFSEGFLYGWDACLKYLGEIPWNEAMNEICNR